jgi:hypothetical protein
MLAAREKLRPLLDMSQGGSSWRDDPKYFHSGDGPKGSVNFSPAWFQQGHDVGALVYTVHFSAANSESGNGATIPTGVCELPLARCIGVARCHLRIECNNKRHPGGNSP